MLETQVCQWRQIKLGFNATSRRTAADFAHCLKRINKLWLEVGVSDQAKKWAELAKNKADIPKLLAKTAMLSLLGSWGRTENYKYTMIIGHPDDCMFDDNIEIRKNPGCVFHDITYKQKLLSNASYICLNLIGREQERIQIARLLRLLHLEPRRFLSIQVDAVYIQPGKREKQALIDKVRNIRYSDLHRLIHNPLPKAFMSLDSKANK